MKQFCDFPINLKSLCSQGALTAGGKPFGIYESKKRRCRGFSLRRIFTNYFWMWCFFQFLLPVSMLNRAFYLGFAAVLLVVPSGPTEARTYEIDPSLTSISFTVKVLHMPWSGQFTDFSGKFRMGSDGSAGDTMNLAINSKSVRFVHRELEGRIRGPSIFDSEAFPLISFTSTNVDIAKTTNEISGEKEGTVTGDLTLRGVTQRVTMHVSLTPEEKSTDRLRLSAKGSVRGTDFGMNLPFVVTSDIVALDVEGVAKVILEPTRVNPLAKIPLRRHDP